MNKALRAGAQLRTLDALAAGDSPVHRLHPLCKLLLTLVYIALTVSFPGYAFSALAAMALYPAIGFACAGLGLGQCLYRLRFVLPLLAAVGLANPWFDRTVLFYLGKLPVTGGVVSMLTLLCKGVFSLLASYLLMATTPVDTLCAALRRIHVPALPVTLLLLTYRYISLLLEQAAVMADAYALRAPGQRGVHIHAWGTFLGQLLLRSVDRAGTLYQSMQLRGFTGQFDHIPTQPLHARALVLTGAVIAMLVCMRCIDLPAALGQLFGA